MPSKYNFLQLSPTEFQFLCRDLLQRHISQELNTHIVFNNYTEGKDEGKDAFFENTEYNIFLQCKRYKEFKNLYSELKNHELNKIKRLSPGSRYILATSVDLTPQEMDKLFQLLSPYLKSVNDIVGQSKLNNLLDLYSDVKLNYPQLYLYTLDVLTHILNSKTFNRSTYKLEEFSSISKYYVASPSFSEAHNILRKNHFLIISGEPGIGKSTMAGMICLDYYQQGYEFIFIRSNISEAMNLCRHKEKLIFFFDDFLGTPFLHDFRRNENSELLEFINIIQKTKDNFLVITTREYVFRQAENKYPEFKELNYFKCILTQRHFTEVFKIRILYNYLYYSHIEYKHIEWLLNNDNYMEILSHPHFTPRLLNDYINKKYDKKGDSPSFYLGLKKYLDNPYEYWEGVFKSLNDNAQMLLLIMAISEEPILEEIIFKTFKKINKLREIYKKGHEKDSFEKALFELSESFIKINYNPEYVNEEFSSRLLSLILTNFQDKRYIEFQNPSIRDFLIHYLRKREDLTEILLKSAITFNQLFYIFTTRENDKYIESPYNDNYFQQEKIKLSIHLKGVIINKILEEFDNMPIIQSAQITWQDEVSTFHVKEANMDNKMEKLYMLTIYFPLKYVTEIKEFVTNKYNEIIQQIKSNEQQEKNNLTAKTKPLSLSLEERMSQVKVIKALSPYVSFDPQTVIKEYQKNIIFAKEYIVLYELDKLYPDEFKKIIISDLENIRKKIKNLIQDDVYYLYGEDEYDSINLLKELIYDDIYTLSDLYGFKITPDFLKSLNEAVDTELFALGEENVESELIEEELIEDVDNHTFKELLPPKNDYVYYKDYQTQLHKLIPSWKLFSTNKETAEYIDGKLKDLKLNPNLRNKIIRFSNRHNLSLNLLSADLLIRYCAQNLTPPKSLDTFFEYCLDDCHLSKEHIISLMELGFKLWENEIYIFRKETKNIVNLTESTLNNFEYLINSSLCYNDDLWYKFFSKKFHIWLASKYVADLPSPDKKTFYRKFINDYPYADNPICFLSYCYKMDRTSVLKYLIVPYFEEELSEFYSSTPEITTITFIKKQNITYSYKLDKQTNSFEPFFSYCTDPLTRDLFTILNLKIATPDIILEDYFNVSLCEFTPLKKYLRKEFSSKTNMYTIDLTKEIKNEEFYSITMASEIPRFINQYADCLKKFIDKYSNL